MSATTPQTEHQTPSCFQDIITGGFPIRNTSAVLTTAALLFVFASLTTADAREPVAAETLSNVRLKLSAIAGPSAVEPQVQKHVLDHQAGTIEALDLRDLSIPATTKAVRQGTEAKVIQPR